MYCYPGLHCPREIDSGDRDDTRRLDIQHALSCIDDELLKVYLACRKDI